MVRRWAKLTRAVLSGIVGVAAGVLGMEAREPAEIFVDVTEQAGLAFTYHPGASGALHLPEVMGPGAALVDLDNDGDLDVYLVQAGRLGPKGEPLAPADHDRVYRNDLAVRPDGTRQVTFRDVSDAYGLTAGGYGMGVAAGDFDNDGWTDLLITGYGSTRLLRNVQGRRLVDVTAAAGVSDTGWSVSAAWIDYDRDGWLDLLLVRYVTYTPVACVLRSGRRDYCGPKSFAPQADRLFHNTHGRLVDVSSTALAGARPAPGLGVVSADVNDDGFIDLYLANDGTDNYLWLNQQGRRFKEDGLLAGAALNTNGVAEAGMGTDAGDVDGDGDLDLVVTNLTGETNTLYINSRLAGDAVFFDDRTGVSGLGPASLPLTGFGTRLLDYDNDGRLDLVVVNGGVHVSDAMPTPAGPREMAEPRLLFRNLGDGRFAETTQLGGRAFVMSETSRGLAVGDVDNDGDPDLLIANNEYPVRLLLNTVGQQSHWLGLRAVTADGKRDAQGATIWLRRRGAPPVVRHVHADGSYASSSDPRVLFGIHDAVIEAVDVRWPDGTRERFGPPPADRYTTLRQGTGRPAPVERQPLP